MTKATAIAALEEGVALLAGRGLNSWFALELEGARIEPTRGQSSKTPSSSTTNESSNAASNPSPRLRVDFGLVASVAGSL